MKCEVCLKEVPIVGTIGLDREDKNNATYVGELGLRVLVCDECWQAAFRMFQRYKVLPAAKEKLARWNAREQRELEAYCARNGVIMAEPAIGRGDKLTLLDFRP